ncbi:chromosomal replication initiator protein DnaA [Candidatus Curtissbacteria bacterium RIFCSPHIGHO2_02_FULL_40_17]|uniref:Chromosomal replication initiator protein DnaA n=4 Tax=Candidatus Curtissiibacteriota TaxID=1752717 RepID=A0A1F5GH58_9BACT|nr:MAG: chromosomal replication initiator protein DnaA [Candidatus Curtissbacteria bacterium RIFCSPHIGHO2_01_FULL_40_12]OGD91208.1 MAG: chromosomal replication initiator protein DnaA [Candidatus Curtissbacteria bacterium RIFCSPHIGHO2_02_FULL_40_17]OGE03223.1 MAG: chromosomal replication initiator protein DnaA [Candidatus Curtissbacteria bacterium RIFCSPHIGHO2_12_FULL_41_17]OGE06205.1 MAG: chromosomal replication initiator protein DnaA [Candidatus Curtissbacteria bacterium RIFCSPLOWO2_02_FULL_40_
MEAKKIWAKILSEIKRHVSASTFKTWFAGSFIVEYKKTAVKSVLIIAFKNNFLKEQVEKRYLPQVAKIASRELGEPTEILLIVTQKQNQIKEKGPIFSGVAPLQFLKTRQANDLKSDHTFDNFVVGNSNNLAYLVAKQVSENPGTNYNPLLFFGPTGVGKTHLLQAIGNAIKKRAIEAKILYASAEKFTNDYLESLSFKTQASFRARYRGSDVLLVDDIQFLAGKESTQEEFFYTFNELYLANRQIVIAADRHPKELGKLKERLVSRFLQGMVADIAPPDFEMKMAILKTKCKERGMSLDDESISYIANTCFGSARELEGVLISTFSLAKLSGNKVDLAKIKLIVERNQTNNQKATPQTIIEAVCSYFNVKPSDLSSPSRKSNLVFARQILMYLLRKELQLPLSAIGQFVGGRDHSTIIHGVEKVEKDVLSNQPRKDEVLRIRSLFNNYREVIGKT